ncbi:unnamed protein product [Aphanomyces euteiches]
MCGPSDRPFSNHNRTTVHCTRQRMWQAYVVGALEAASLFVCFVILHTSTDVLYATAKYAPTTVAKGWFHFVCLVSSVGILFYTVISSEGAACLFYTSWNYILQVIYWGWVYFAPSVNYQARFVLFDTIFPASVAVAAVVWLMLFPYYWAGYTGEQGEALINAISFMQHGVNVAFLIVEYVWDTPRLVEWRTVAFVGLLPTTYSLFAIFVHDLESGEWWPLPFLQITQGTSPLWYLALLVIHIVPFFILRWISAWRVGRRATEETTPLV